MDRIANETTELAYIGIAGRRDILDRLAHRLYETMERLDPTEDGRWEHLTELDKEFYRQCVKAVVIELGSIYEFQQ